MNKKIIKEIDTAIKYVWKYDIAKDYEDVELLQEDTLKNAMYFHLRNRLGSILEKYDIRIFTEFNSHKFKGSHCRPDIVIVQIDKESPEEYLGNCIKEYLCIIEIKYKGTSYDATKKIYEDYDKLHHYICDMDLDCPKYYMVTIWEEHPDSKQWLDNQDWAKGLVTELNADYGSKGDMLFYVKKH